MRGGMQAGWYRRRDDAPHIVRRVSGAEGFWITCKFDLRVGSPCEPGRPLSPEAWGTLEKAPDPGFVPG